MVTPTRRERQEQEQEQQGLVDRERYARDRTSPGSRDLARVERQAGVPSARRGPGGRGDHLSRVAAAATPESYEPPTRVVAELLATLVHVGAARRVIDLGLASGASALAMAGAMGEAYDGDATSARSLADSRTVVACAPEPTGLDEVRRVLAQARHGDLVRVLSSTPEAVLADTQEPVDLVRLVVRPARGSVSPERARALVRTLLDRSLLGPQGVLVVENTQEPTSFNDWLAEEQRLRQVLMPLGPGITLARPTR